MTVTELKKILTRLEREGKGKCRMYISDEHQGIRPLADMLYVQQLHAVVIGATVGAADDEKGEK